MRARSTLPIIFAGLAIGLCACGGGTKEPAPATAANDPAEKPATATAATQPTQDRAGDEGSTAKNFEPARATGGVQGVPAPTNTAPIIAIANYFAELPGVDLAGLKVRQRESFLQRVNSELCTCGCKNDTLARCYVNDPRCPVVKKMVQKVLDEVKAGK